MRRRKYDKKMKMNGGLGWIRGLRGQEQDELSRFGMGTIFLVYVQFSM